MTHRYVPLAGDRVSLVVQGDVLGKSTDDRLGRHYWVELDTEDGSHVLVSDLGLTLVRRPAQSEPVGSLRSKTYSDDDGIEHTETVVKIAANAWVVYGGDMRTQEMVPVYRDVFVDDDFPLPGIGD